MDKLIYEVIPPPLKWPSSKVSEEIEQILSLLKTENIRSINLPEVVNESKEQERTVPLLEKMDTLEFIDQLLLKDPSLTLIPNIITVRRPETMLLKWVRTAYEKGIRHLILVGGEKSTIQYPGLTVTRAAKAIKSSFPDLHLGGITIFTRKQEPQRIQHKMENGIEFFVSQIIYETANMKCVLMNLEKLCLQANAPFPRVYLSLVAAEKKTDIEFLEWLGVEFPTALHAYLLEENAPSIETRVSEMLDLILEELDAFISHKSLNLCFNVEQVMYHRQASSLKLIQQIKKRLKGCL